MSSMSRNEAAVVILTALGSFLPGSGFVRTPSTATLRSDTTNHPRRLFRFSTPIPPPRERASRVVWSLFADRQQPSHTSMSSSLPAAGGMDDIDPLEAGPDIDPLEAGPDAVPEPDYTAMEREGDGIRAEEGEPIAPAKKRRGRKPKVAAAAESDDADAQAMAAVAVAAKGSKKSTALMRKRADPFMPKGSIAPLEWAGFVPLEEGCRAHMVIFHTNLPEDEPMLTSLVTQVQERFGKHVNIHTTWDDNEEVSEEERRNSQAFEIWLSGPEPVTYHSRAETGTELTEEHIANILADVHERVKDEALFELYGNPTPTPQYMIPGLSMRDHILKIDYPL